MPLTMLAFPTLDTGSDPRYRSKKACVKTGDSTVPTCNCCNVDEWSQGFLSHLAGGKRTTLCCMTVTRRAEERLTTPDCKHGLQT